MRHNNSTDGSRIDVRNVGSVIKFWSAILTVGFGGSKVAGGLHNYGTLVFVASGDSR